MMLTSRLMCAHTQQFPTRPRGFCVAAFEETFFIKRFISERRTRWLLLFLLCFYFPIGERKEEGEHLKRRTGTWENSAYHSVKRACVDGKLRERKRWERGEPFPPPIFRASFDPPSLKSITFPMKRKPIQRRKKKKKTAAAAAKLPFQLIPKLQKSATVSNFHFQALPNSGFQALLFLLCGAPYVVFYWSDQSTPPFCWPTFPIGIRDCIKRRLTNDSRFLFLQTNMSAVFSPHQQVIESNRNMCDVRTNQNRNELDFVDRRKEMKNSFNNKNVKPKSLVLRLKNKLGSIGRAPRAMNPSIKRQWHSFLFDFLRLLQQRSVPPCSSFPILNTNDQLGNRCQNWCAALFLFYCRRPSPADWGEQQSFQHISPSSIIETGRINRKKKRVSSAQYADSVR